MPAEIVDGKALSAQIRQTLREKIAKLANKPRLAIILAGHDGPSEIYVKNKQKAGCDIGIDTVLYRFEDDVNQKALEDLVETLNKDREVHGILVQLPLPKQINAFDVLSKIDPKKDVDGFHPYNVGLLQKGEGDFLCAATPKGVLALLKKTGIELCGKNALVIGRSNIVGKPLAMLLLNQDCTVIVAHSKTKDLQALCRQADIVVSATGCSKLIKADFLKPGAVVIDVGICRDENGKLCGDVDFEACQKVASYITPVPGGVGPMTIAMLFENVLNAYLKQQQ